MTARTFWAIGVLAACGVAESIRGDEIAGSIFLAAAWIVIGLAPRRVS